MAGHGLINKQLRKLMEIIIIKTNQKAHEGIIAFDDENLEIYTDLTATAANTYGYDFYPVHLYELSDDEIKIGDWVISKMFLEDKNVTNPAYKYVLLQVGRITDKAIYNVEENFKIPLGNYCKKIISTTDNLDNISKMSQETIEQFIKQCNNN